MAKDSPEHRFAWDACVVIDCLQKQEPRPYQWIRPLVEDPEANRLLVVISALTIAEVTFVRGVPQDEQLNLIDGFYDYPWVRLEAAGTNILKVAKELRRDKSKPVAGIDSVHLATALVSDATVFLTYDGSARTRNKTPLLPLDNQLSLPGKAPLRIRTPEEHQRALLATSHPLIASHLVPPPSTPPLPNE